VHSSACLPLVIGSDWCAVPNALVTGKRKAGALVGPPKSKK